MRCKIVPRSQHSRFRLFWSTSEGPAPLALQFDPSPLADFSDAMNIGDSVGKARRLARTEAARDPQPSDARNSNDQLGLRISIHCRRGVGEQLFVEIQHPGAPLGLAGSAFA